MHLHFVQYSQKLKSKNAKKCFSNVVASFNLNLRARRKIGQLSRRNRSSQNGPRDIELSMQLCLDRGISCKLLKWTT